MDGRVGIYPSPDWLLDQITLDGFEFSGYSDTSILQTSVAVSTVITLANVGLELAWKLAFDQNLIATSHTLSVHVHGHAGGICCQSNVNLAIIIKI